MDWSTFAVEIVKALAWPVTVLLGLSMLRKPIVGLIPLLQRLKYKEFEMEFGEQVRDAKADAMGELPASVSSGLAVGQDTIRELARVSPRAAVTEAWRQVEAALDDAARRTQIPLGYRESGSSPSAVMRRLVKAGVVDEGKASLFHELRGLRNQAVHAPEFALSRDAVIEYADLANRLAEYLRGAARARSASPE